MPGELKTTIGLEIHVQLKTKSKMFCRCDNNAEGKAPNTVVCPVCLGLPGALPVANKQAVEWTIKTGLAINAKIPKIAKFDRKHYFYPDLPKGYQISQYDEPFCQGGAVEIRNHATSPQPSPNLGEGVRVRFNRIHLEEDAGKLIHSNGKSLVDLNRAGTPLMEMVTEPDITSPKLAGDFLRRLQKLVRDEVKVSEADMEKGHLRCDANISVCEVDSKMDDEQYEQQTTKPKIMRMSEIVEIKNLNSFRFVEKALALEEERLKNEYPNWPVKKTKVTRGYDSKNNRTYVQRQKEEAADYRYFPEPDLPPFDTSGLDLEVMKSEIGESLESRMANLISLGVGEGEAKVLVSNREKRELFEGIAGFVSEENKPLLARAVVHNYFPFAESAKEKYKEYANGIIALAKSEISKAQFSEIAKLIHEESKKTFTEAIEAVGGGKSMAADEIGNIIDRILIANPNEVARYKTGQKQLIGFFVGQVMRETQGKADPQLINKMLREKLGEAPIK